MKCSCPSIDISPKSVLQMLRNGESVSQNGYWFIRWGSHVKSDPVYLSCVGLSLIRPVFMTFCHLYGEREP